MKTKIFSYYLQKLAEEEQKLLGVDNNRAALLALVLTKADLFRRFPTGCTTQELYFCEPRYVQELFVYICLRAKENGCKLRSMFDFTQTILYAPGMWGKSCVEDHDVSLFLEKVFPEVKTKKAIDRKSYAELLPEIPKSEWKDKFVQLSNFRNVNLDVLCPLEAGEETALIDAALTELKKDKIFRRMLSMGNRCDIYGQSFAYNAYFQQIKDFPKGD